LRLSRAIISIALVQVMGVKRQRDESLFVDSGLCPERTSTEHVPSTHPPGDSEPAIGEGSTLVKHDNPSSPHAKNTANAADSLDSTVTRRSPLGRDNGFGTDFVTKGNYGGFAQAAAAAGNDTAFSAGHGFASTTGCNTRLPTLENVFSAQAGKPVKLFEADLPSQRFCETNDSQRSQRAEHKVNLTTGEESESTLFSGEGSLYEYVSVGEKNIWQERGKGEMRINVEDGKARMIMRARGVLRLLLNARLWVGMKFTIMDNNRGVSFTCVNTVGDNPNLSNFAFRMSAREKDDILKEMVSIAEPFTAIVPEH